MKKYLRMALLDLALVAVCLPAFAHEQEDLHLTGRAARLYKQGKKAEALEAAQQALKAAERRYGLEHVRAARAV